MKRKFQRSDIPYKDRLLMQRHDNIRDHRDEAARVAMQLACVALNDTEGLLKCDVCGAQTRAFAFADEDDNIFRIAAEDSALSAWNRRVENA